MRRPVLAVLSLAALLAAPSAAKADEGDIIVQRVPGLDRQERADLRDGAGVDLVETLPIAQTEVVAPQDGNVAEALRELRASGQVVSAEPDQPVSVSASAPNDFYWTSLWGLYNTQGTDIDALDAWDLSRGAGVTVAVVDTGINATHDDLAGQIVGNAREQGGGRETNGVDDDHNGLIDDWRGWDFSSDDNDPTDLNGHGSHVSGTIAATGSNDSGVVGVAPQAKLLPVRALDDKGSGWMSDIAASFAYAADSGAPIVSASLGGGYASVLENVISGHPNTLFVIAAGNEHANNDDPSTADYPCAMPEANIVCVGASDQQDQRASFSNFGSTTVDLFAPGTNIVSTWIGSRNAYRILQGTSMATPHVAGTAALMKAANPSATAAQIKWALLSSVDVKPQLAGLAVSGGRLNAFSAVAAIKGTLPPTPTAQPTPEPPAPAPPPVETPAPPVEAPAPGPVAPPAVPAPAAPVPAVPTPVPTGALVPQLSGVTIGGSLKTAKSKLRVKFSLSRPATVRFTITLRGKRIATWTRTGRGGVNSVTLTRKLPTGRTLKRGAYKLAVGLNARATTSRAIRVP